MLLLIKRGQYLSVGKGVRLLCAKALSASKQIIFRHQRVNVERLEAHCKRLYAHLGAILATVPIPTYMPTSTDANFESCDVASGSMGRRIQFDMISMTEAHMIVLEAAAPLQSEAVALNSVLYRTAAEDVISQTPFPPFLISIMDGYAVIAPITPGIYPVESVDLAGVGETHLSPGKVAYITTGAKLPIGANAVIKVEDTRGINGSIDIVNEAEVECETGGQRYSIRRSTS
jgi:MoeA N-terminal region (domain I and II)